MADTLQFGPEWLRTLSHGSSGHASSQGLAPLTTRGTSKSASIQYSRDAFLSFYNASVSAEVPEGLRSLPEIMADRTLQPMAWIPQSNDEVHMLALSAKSNAPGVRIELEPPIRHRAKNSWNESANFRETDDSVGRSKHSRDEFRDESCSSKTFESVRGRNIKDGTTPRPPEFSRSMSSDNWREAKKKEVELEVASSSWRSRTEHTRTGGNRNWRETADREGDVRGGRLRRGSDSLHHDRGDHSRKKNFEKSYGSDEDEAELPEWSIEGVEDVGTFDATGVFIPMGNIKDTEDWNPEEFEEDCDNEVDEQVGTLSPDDSAVENRGSAGQAISHEPNQSDQFVEKCGELKQMSVTDNFQYIQSREELSDNAVTAAASSVDLNNCVKMASSNDFAGSIASEDFCVPLNDVQSVAAANESDIDFIRLGVVPENLVASLFDDDSNAVSSIRVEQKQVAEPRKGFVSPDHADANNWFYQDPQGVIQGPFRPSEMGEWFNAGYFSQNLNVKLGCDSGFLQLGELIKKVGQDPFSERSFGSQSRGSIQTNANEGRSSAGMPEDSNPGALQSADQLQLLQLLMKKQQQQQETLRQQHESLRQQQQENLRQQQTLPQTNQQQQQALLQLLLQSQGTSAQQSSHIQPQQQFIRPRAIKSQQSHQPQPTMSDMGLQQQRDVTKVDQAAKLAELISQQGNAAGPLGALTPEQKALLQLILRQQAMSTSNQQLQPNRPIQASSSFHRSVSQPVGIELSGLSTAGWNVPGSVKSSATVNNLGGSSFGASATVSPATSMWRGANCVPSNAEAGGAWKSDYPGRMTVEELEALQFIAAEKARQEQQKRQAAADEEAKEQLKAVLLQRRQQQVTAERERQQQQIDERRLAAVAAVSVDRTAEFDIRERQRHEELRRRQEKADELRRHQQIELLRSLPLASDSQSFQLALSAVNGYGATNLDQRRDFSKATHDPSIHSIGAAGGNNYWHQKDVEAAKTSANITQWHHNQQPLAVGGNFTTDGRPSLPMNVHAKMPSESSSWDDIIGGLSAKSVTGNNNAISASAQMLSMAQTQPGVSGGQPGTKSLKDEGLQKLVQVTAYKEEFARWCEATVKSFHANINVQVFIKHLNEVETAQEVAQYVRTYLGNSPETMSFIQMYWEKRECCRQQNKMIQELVFQCMKSGKW